MGCLLCALLLGAAIGTPLLHAALEPTMDRSPLAHDAAPLPQQSRATLRAGVLRTRPLERRRAAERVVRYVNLILAPRVWALEVTALTANEHVLAALGSRSTSSRPIAPGSWEHGELDELKALAASLLADVFRGEQLWGFKDPRTTRLFPFWREVLRGLGPSVSIVLAIRDPLSAATSLAIRNNIPISDAEALWLAYMLPWLPDIADYPVLVVDYERLVDAPLRQLRRIAKHLGVAIDPTDVEIAEYTSSFVDDGLRHQMQEDIGRRWATDPG